MFAALFKIDLNKMKMSSGNYVRIVGMLLGVLLVTGCKKDDPEPENEPTEVIVPETYSFDNVNFSGQSERLAQLDEMIAYMETANENGETLDAQVLRDMFENTGGNGGGHFSFTSTKQLRDKCFEPHQSQIEAYLDAAAAASLSTDAASNGTAGRMTSGDGTKQRLFDANGLEYAEVVEKSIMGAVFYYQATATYLSDEKMEVDNTTVEEGEGTAMQHHWDEAYGYLGVTTGFPENTADVKYWGKYCVGRDAVLNTTDELSYAFRKGRAAIGVKRYDERDAAITEVRKAWEEVCVGTAIHYLNAAMNHIADDYQRNHELSEATAFISSLFYNPEKTITDTQLQEVQALIGTNFYEVTEANLLAARNKLAEIHGLDEVKDLL